MMPTQTGAISLPPDIHSECLQHLLDGAAYGDVAKTVESVSNYLSYLQKDVFGTDSSSDFLSVPQRSLLNQLERRCGQAASYIEQYSSRTDYEHFEYACRLVPWLADKHRDALATAALRVGSGYFASVGLKELCKHHALLPSHTRAALVRSLNPQASDVGPPNNKQTAALLGMLSSSSPTSDNLFPAELCARWIEALTGDGRGSEGLWELVGLLDRLEEAPRRRVVSDALKSSDDDLADKGAVMARLAAMSAYLTEGEVAAVRNWTEEHSAAFPFSWFSPYGFLKDLGGATVPPDPALDRALTQLALRSQGHQGARNRLVAIVHACAQQSAEPDVDQRNEMLRAFSAITHEERADVNFEFWAAAGAGLWRHLEPEQKAHVKHATVEHDEGPSGRLRALTEMATFLPRLDDDSRHWLVSSGMEVLNGGGGAMVPFLHAVLRQRGHLNKEDVEDVISRINDLEINSFARADELGVVHESCIAGGWDLSRETAHEHPYELHGLLDSP